MHDVHHQMAYETLPEVTDEMVKIVARDAEGKKIGQIPVADVEIEIVDPVTYLEFNGTDFATNNVTEVGVKVTYGEVIGTGKLTLTPVTLKVQPVNGFALVVGEEIGTPAAEDFIVDMYADTEFVQRLDSSDVELYYVTSSNDKYAANRAPSSTSAEIFVAGTYLGAETADTPDASAKIAVVNPEAVDKMTISAVSLAEDYKSPAKQYYTNIARDVVASVDDVASITFAIDYADETKKDVESAVVEADKLSGTLTVAYSTTNDKFTALAKEDDINKDGAKLYLYVTYTQDGVTGTYYVDLSSATSETAEITALELKRTYGTAVNDNPVYGSAVTYTVTTSNEYGDVERDVELTDDALDAYTVLVNDVQGTLPSVGETAQSVVVYLTADSRVISNAVEVEAGSDYIPDAQVGSITVSFSEAGKAKMLYVGDVISKVYEASDFVVSGYTSALNATTGLAEVVRVAVAAPEKATADTDAITVVYEYVAEDGTTATKTANVEVSPISWAAPSSNTLTLTYGEGENEIAFSTNGSTGLPAGTYNWTDFATNLVSYGIEADQVAKFAYTPSNANSSATSNGFTINDVYAEGTISVTYTAKDTAAESGVKETTVTFAVNGVAAN